MKKININYLIIILFIFSLIYKPLIIFFIPGILIFYLKKERKKENEFIQSLGYMISFSMAFWVISIWFLKIINFSLIKFVYIIIFLTFLIFLINIRKKNKIEFSNKIILFVLLIIFFLRLIPFFILITPPGIGDSSMHSYTTKLIVENDGLPDSYKPLLLIEHFGTYAVGFHTISALISLLNGLEVYRSVFLLSVLVYGFFTLAFYIFLRNYFNKKTSLITAIVATFITTYPQLIFHWGGSPTALSFYFILVVFSILIKKNIRFIEMILIAFFISASFLTHSNPFLTFFYIFLLLIIIKFNLKYILKLIPIGIISLLMLSPYLINLDVDFSQKEMSALKEKTIDHLIMPSIKLPRNIELLVLGPIQGIAVIGVPFSILAFIGLFFTKRKLVFSYLAFSFAIILLIINSQYWLLPFTFLLFTDRIALFFIIPLSIFVASLVNFILKKIKIRYILFIFILYLLIGIIYFVPFNITFENSPYNLNRSSVSFNNLISLSLFQSVGGSAILYFFGMGNQDVITTNDLKAFEWIKKNTNKHDLFLNNMNDAGLFIPAIAFRSILLLHISTPLRTEYNKAYNIEKYFIPEKDLTTLKIAEIDYKNLIKDLKKINVKYIYIGKKNFKKPELIPEMFENKNYLKVYDKNGVKIYKVIY